MICIKYKSTRVIGSRKLRRVVAALVAFVLTLYLLFVIGTLTPEYPINQMQQQLLNYALVKERHVYTSSTPEINKTDDDGRTVGDNEPPSTFIPYEPDTSPLGRPPDIPKRFIIEEADYCHRHPDLQVIAFVPSSIGRASERNLTRTSWANASAYDMGDISVNIGVVFLIGRAKSLDEQKIIHEESQRYHDIVQGDYGDHYRLLTYKGLAGLYWISRHCAHVPWTLHSDDDTHIDIFLYHRALKELDDEAKKMFICSHMYGPVLRTGRWKVRYEEFPQDEYPLYCSGGVWFLQTKLVPKLLEASKSVNFLWVDDAYVTGLLAEKAGIGRFPFHNYYGGAEIKLTPVESRSESRVLVTKQPFKLYHYRSTISIIPASSISESR
ncbi:hypothetical protein Pmani_021463 [Petrolisthes manimaculis]|uniref:Hexosyltransferase n=1 Tax=Petrolisthes manimaculis TaxID=1843537 RepID=A0AAE1U5A4_9EUCA|nr:hypothetical protein Pmani_021463 [Petrolisthes manimaculis]